MKYITTFLTVAGLSLIANYVNAHVGWESIENETCTAQYDCRDTPLELTSGSTISVVYDVVIQHGAPIQIDISGLAGSVATVVLKDNLPENSGLNSTDITLPNVTCTSCVLTVRGSGYSGKADIKLLSHEPQGEANAPQDVLDAVTIAEDNQIRLMWHNPTTNFSNVIILQAEGSIEGHINDGENYSLGDTVGNGEVVYRGNAEQWQATGLMRNTPYYFKVFSANSTSNYSDGITLEALTTDIGNNPPWITLELSQNSTHSHGAVSRENGLVSLQAMVMDADTQDTHYFDWTGTNEKLINTSDRSDWFIFDPMNLKYGDYTIRVRVADDGDPMLTKEAEITVTIMAEHDHAMQTENPPRKKGGAVDSRFALLMLLILCGVQLRSIRTKRDLTRKNRNVIYRN